MGATESHWERGSSLCFFFLNLLWSWRYLPGLATLLFLEGFFFFIKHETPSSLDFWNPIFFFWLQKKYSFANHLLFSNVQIAINNSRFFSANLVTNKLLHMQKWKPFPFENSLSYAWLGEVREKLASRCQAASLLHTNNDSEPGTDDPSGTFHILHRVHSWPSPGRGLTIWCVCVYAF